MARAPGEDEIPPPAERLQAPGPKRVLALDAGGSRLLLALGQLAEIERRIARRSNSDRFRLSHYYDLICGSSTAAIPALGLALGRSVREVAELMLQLAPILEEDDFVARGGPRKRHPEGAVEAALEAAWGAPRLGGAELATGVAFFIRRFDQGLWTPSNHPRQQGWDALAAEGAAKEGGDGAGQAAAPFLAAAWCNRLALASMAAPTLYDGRRIEIWPGLPPVAATDVRTAGLHSPALAALRLVTDPAGPFAWDTGPDRLMLTSIGTGLWRAPATEADVLSFAAAKSAPALTIGHMAATSGFREQAREQAALLRELGAEARRPGSEKEPAPAAPLSPVPLFHLQRFDPALDAQTFAQLDVALDDKQLAAARRDALGDMTVLSLLFTAGQRVAAALMDAPGEEDTRTVERIFFPRGFEPPGYGRKVRVAPQIRLEALGRTFNRDEAD